MKVMVGTLRAASELCCLCYYADAARCVPTCQYANMPTNIPILLLPVVLSPVLTQIVHSAVMR